MGSRSSFCEALLKSKRKQVHEQVARVLEKNFAETVQMRPELVGHHYAEAGLSAEAIPYWYAAGKRAAQGSAHLEAIAHLSRGLELVETLPDTPESCEQKLALHMALGPVLIATKGYAAPEVRAVYDRAHVLCRQVGSSAQFPVVLFGLFAFYLVRADHEKALALAKDLLAFAESMQDRTLLVQAHNALGLTFFFQGDFFAAREHLGRCLTLYDREQDCNLAFSYAGQDPRVTASVFSAWTAQASGYSDQAREKTRDALSSAQQLSHPYSLAYARGIAAAVYQFRNEAALAQAEAEASLSIATEQGFPFWSTFQSVLLGRVLVSLGKADEGIARMICGMEAYRATGAQLLRPYFIGLLAGTFVEKGSIERGLSLLEEALETVEITGERFYEAELYRQKGELLSLSCREQLDSQDLTAQSSRCSKIEGCFLKAISVARRQQAKWFELRSALSLARLWQRRGRIEEAHVILAPIYGWFTEGFDAADLKEAKALLDELSGAA